MSPRALLVCCLAIPACVVESPPPDTDSWPVWDAADAFEAEPNDVAPTDLGAVEPNFSVAGTSEACGSSGSWDGADVDLLAFHFEADALVRLRLRAAGADMDMELFDPDGGLLASLDSSGAAEEEVDVALEAGADYSVRIRCWLGNDPRWILALVDRG